MESILPHKLIRVFADWLIGRGYLTKYLSAVMDVRGVSFKSHGTYIIADPDLFTKLGKLIPYV